MPRMWWNIPRVRIRDSDTALTVAQYWPAQLNARITSKWQLAWISTFKTQSMDSFLPQIIVSVCNAQPTGAVILIHQICILRNRKLLLLSMLEILKTMEKSKFVLNQARIKDMLKVVTV